MSIPTAIDLFAGAGGMSVGLKRAGFRVIAAIDNDPMAASTYISNHPQTVFWYTDIRKLTPRAILAFLRIRAGELDLLAGCPPCQGFSSVRTRNGSKRIRDVRNELVLAFGKFVSALRPKTVLLENVPGLADDKRLVDLRRLLKRIGYASDQGVFDAAHFGVPQRRRRLIMVAVRRGEPGFAKESVSEVTVKMAIGSLPRPGRSGDDLHDLKSIHSKRVQGIIRKIPRDGGSRSDAKHLRRLRCHRENDGFKDVYGRLAWNAVAPTITGGCINPSKGRFLHPSQNRALTLREAAILQSFPPHYHFDLSRGKYAVARMIGNALPSEFVCRQAKILKRLAARPKAD